VQPNASQIDQVANEANRMKAVDEVECTGGTDLMIPVNSWFGLSVNTMWTRAWVEVLSISDVHDACNMISILPLKACSPPPQLNATIPWDAGWSEWLLIDQPRASQDLSPAPRLVDAFKQTQKALHASCYHLTPLGQTSVCIHQISLVTVERDVPRDI
jgi:hypothetical protein